MQPKRRDAENNNSKHRHTISFVHREREAMKRQQMRDLPSFDCMYTYYCGGGLRTSVYPARQPLEWPQHRPLLKRDNLNFFFPAVNVDSNESTSGYSISERQPKATKVWQVPSHFSALLNISSLQYS